MANTAKKVLVVEDNAVQVMMIKRLVKELGHEIIATVDRGEKAVEKTFEHEPDLIIMDIFLNGDMSGVDAMEEIRKTSDVPVIYISGNSDSYYMWDARKTNFSDFLFKPISRNVFLKAIRKVVGKNTTKKPRFMQKPPWPFSLFA